MAQKEPARRRGPGETIVAARREDQSKGGPLGGGGEGHPGRQGARAKAQGVEDARRLTMEK